MDLLGGVCGAHGGYETTEVRDVRRTGGGRGLRGEQGEKWMGCLLDDLRAFCINVDQWTNAAPDEEEWGKTADQGAGRFIAKWIAAEKARVGLPYTVECPNVTGRTKERIAQSKRDRAGALAIVD